MKKIIKLFFVIIFCLFVITGCNDDVVPDDNKEENKTSEYDNYNKNIGIVSLGKYEGEFGYKFAIYKINNENIIPLYVNLSFQLYNSNKVMLYNRDMTVRVGANTSAYAIVRQDIDEDPFDSIGYTYEVRKEELKDYFAAYSSIRVSGIDTGKNIKVNISNQGNRTISAYGLVFFYKGGTIVEVLEANYINLMPTGVQEVIVDYPLKKANTKISFDKFEVVLNEVGTEL